MLFEIYTPVISSNSWIWRDESYKFDTICAVARSDVRVQGIYHVNFLATRMDAAADGDQDKRVLFFAQVFLGGKNSVRSFCCSVHVM